MSSPVLKSVIQATALVLGVAAGFFAIYMATLSVMTDNPVDDVYATHDTSGEGVDGSVRIPECVWLDNSVHIFHWDPFPHVSIDHTTVKYCR